MHIMAKDIVYVGQSFFNKVVECTGNADNSFEMFKVNNFNLFPAIGSKLKSSKITNHSVVDFFNDLNRPASLPIKIPNENYLIPGEFPYSF